MGLHSAVQLSFNDKLSVRAILAGWRSPSIEAGCLLQVDSLDVALSSRRQSL